MRDDEASLEIAKCGHAEGDALAEKFVTQIA